MPTLHWLTREEDLKAAANAEYRLLVEDEKYSYGESDTGNLIAQGDNLEALKALLPFYAGQVKCIYIDSPYNTGMFIQVRYAEKTLKQDMTFHKQIEQIHIYRKSYNARSNLNTIESNFDKFTFYISEKDEGKPITLGNKNVVVFQPNEYEIKEGEGSDNGLKEIWASGTILDGNSSGRFFRDYLTGRYEINGYGVLYKVYGIGDDKFDYRYFTGQKRQGATKGKYYQGVPMEQLENPSDLKELPIENYIDFAADFGNCRSEGGVEFRSGKKPEILLQKILTHFSSNGDLILDSFLGSATTAAVAHKMKRRYIGIEIGRQAETHCFTRLKNVVDGDKTGISKAVNWQGGGFRFFSLGEAISDNERRIKENITFENLAAHIYFTETKTPMKKHKKNSTFLGVYNGTAYALLYNGILGDKSVSGGNVLIHATLNHIRHDIELAERKEKKKFEYNQIVIYGEATRLTHVSLQFNNIIFKQTPYDIKVW